MQTGIGHHHPLGQGEGGVCTDVIGADALAIEKGEAVAIGDCRSLPNQAFHLAETHGNGANNHTVVIGN